MRVLAANHQDDFRVKAYAGTNGVLLAMDLAEPRRKGLLGIDNEKQQGSKPLAITVQQPDLPRQGSHLCPFSRHSEQYRAAAEVSLGRLRGQSGDDHPLSSPPGLRQRRCAAIG